MNNNAFIRWKSNALWNLGAGFVSVLSSVLMTYILTRGLTANELLLWNLIFPIFALSQNLSSGILSSMSRYVARFINYSNEGKLALYNIFKSLTFSISGLIMAISVLLIIYMYFCGNVAIINSIGESYFVFIALIFSIGAGVNVISYFYGGYFVGLQLNKYWSGGQSFARLFTLLMVMFGIKLNGLDGAVIGYFIGVISLLLVLRIFYNRISDINFGQKSQKLWGGEKRLRKSVIGMFGVMTIQNISALIVTYGMVYWVASLNVDSVNAASIIVTIILIFNAISISLTSPLVPIFVKLKKLGNFEAKISAVIKKLMFATMLLCVALFLMYQIIGLDLLSLWVGERYAKEVHGVIYFVMLIVVIRTASLPLSFYILSIRKSGYSLIATAVEISSIVIMFSFVASENALRQVVASTFVATMLMFFTLVYLSRHLFINVKGD